MFYVNGNFVEESRATISVLDLGIVRGYGVFECMRTYNGRPFHLQDHLERLRYSAAHIGIPLPHSEKELETIVETLLAKYPGEESCIRIFVTGGTSLDHLMPEEKPSCIVSRAPLKTYAPSLYTQGIRAITTHLERSMPMSKTTHYAPAILALKKGGLVQAGEALYTNERRELLEGTTSNLFAFKKGVLITPESDEILLGITREVVLRLARGRFPIEFRTLPEAEIGELDEAFLTSSTREVIPLVQIDQKPVGNGLPGPLTKALMAAFRSYAQEGKWPLLAIPRHKI